MAFDNDDIVQLEGVPSPTTEASTSTMVIAKQTLK
jgi:hypothetical protein